MKNSAIVNQVHVYTSRAAFSVRLRVDSESTPRGSLAQFALRVCLGGASKAPQTSEMTQKVPLTLASDAANQNCSFDCKRQPPMEDAILKNPFSQSELFF